MRRRSLFCGWMFGVLGLAVFPAPVSAQQILHRFDGDSAGELSGFAVSGAGDLNQDGFGDLLVGAPRHDGAANNAGRVRAFSGADGSLLYTFDGPASYYELGYAVSNAGDVNADGFPDIILGAPQTGWPLPTGPGIAVVHSGLDGSQLLFLRGDASGDAFGAAVSGAGDVDGDGHADLLVGAPRADPNGIDAGLARVFSGFDGSLLFELVGPAPGSQFGTSVSDAGDVDGDGRPDVMVGAPYDPAGGSGAGSAAVFSGFDGSTLFTIVGTTAQAKLGQSVSGAGDVDADGTPDLLVGVPNASNTAFWSGSARIYSGANGSLLYELDGGETAEFFGFSVSGVGDADGDGFADVLVGGPFAGPSGRSSGNAKLLSGADGSTLFKYEGESRGDSFGRAVSGAGDVNGDGLADVIVGAFMDDDGAVDGGSAQVFAGGPPPPLVLSLTPLDGGESGTATITGATPLATVFLGYSRAGLGQTAIPPLGVVSDLQQARLLAALPTDAAGSASFTQLVSVTLIGTPVWFQAAEQGALSNWVRREVQ